MFMIPVGSWPLTQGQIFRIFDTSLHHTLNFFYLTLAYHIWHMGVSQWEDLLHPFMILMLHWPLTSRSNLWGFWFVFMTDLKLQFALTVISYLAQGSITMSRCVRYIHDPNTCITLTVDLKDKFIGFLTSFCPTHNVCLLWQWLTIFDTWIYHHKEVLCTFMIPIRNWP